MMNDYVKNEVCLKSMGALGEREPYDTEDVAPCSLVQSLPPHPTLGQ